jgi:hypothetical protein
MCKNGRNREVHHFTKRVDHNITELFAQHFENFDSHFAVNLESK